MEAGSSYLTLSKLLQGVGNVIRSNPYLQNVWVIAELSDVRVSGGHCYMELIEKDGSGATVAKTRGAIWANVYYSLRGKFLRATGREISTGMKVLLMGTVNYHSLYGLSFTINDIDPSYTLGDLERLRKEILQRLEREGILNRNRQLEFPLVPQRVAVISASGAAGYGDFMNQLQGNGDGFVFYPHLFGAVMQGDRTSRSVRDALEMVESTIDLWDCVVIIRGGGSTSDLNGFDDYELARGIATFPLPVVVGIGHERDRTVLDEIACVRCKTPTAVAAFLIDRMRNSYGMVVDLVRKISQYSTDALQGERHRLDNAESRIPMVVHNQIIKGERRLSELAHRIERGVLRISNREKERLTMLSHGLERGLSRKGMQEKERLLRLRYRMEVALQGVTRGPSLKIENIENLLRVLSPENTLKRGYSITRVNGKALTSVSEVRAGDEVRTQLLDGEVRSRVE